VPENQKVDINLILIVQSKDNQIHMLNVNV